MKEGGEVSLGWTTVSLEVSASVSSHNSKQDEEDDAAWDEFCQRVRGIAKEERYQDLNLYVSWSGR